jgi:hypothetical protein
MKTTFKTLSALLLATTFTLTSCIKKPEVEPEEETPTMTTTGGNTSAPPPVTSQPADADGVCVAAKVNVSTSIPGTTMTVNVTLGSATASFYTAPGATTFADAGTVQTNDSTHAKQSNNAYVFSPKSAQGINYSSNSKWNISGNGSVSAMSYTSNGFPSTPTLPSLSSFSKATSLTVNSSSVSNADSLCYQITAGSKSIFKMTSASQTSYTFPAADMGTLDATQYGYLTVTAYKFNSTTVSGKKYYFINLNTANKMVEVTN